MRHILLKVIQWIAVRTLGGTLDPHHKLMHTKWYPYVVQQVRWAEKTASAGEHKRAAVVAAVKARFQAKGIPPPPLKDIHLAIECAVRDHEH